MPDNRTQWQSKTNEKVKALLEKLEQGAKDVFTSEKYAAYLKMLAKFHSYSYRNVILILLQYPGATKVAGYNAWQKNFNRHVKRGETGIQILGYTPYKRQVERVKLDKAGKPLLDSKGQQIMEKVTVTVPAYKPVYVYDVEQTEGEPLPEYVTRLQGDDVGDFKLLLASLAELSPYPISFEDVPGSANGYCDHAEKKIVVQQGMSQEMTLKTTIHEIAHAREHGNVQGETLSRQTKEVEAESIAFVVCAHLGIDASDYSFGYVSSWASGRDLPELHASLSHIQKAATEIIDKLDDIVEKARTRETDSPQITSANDITAAPRRYNADGERLWNGKTADQFSNADVQRFMAETQKLLSQSDRESLPASAPASEDAALEHAKDLIDRFCKSEYFSPGEFDDLEKIAIGYTTLTDDEIPIQVYADLVHFRIERYLDDYPLDRWQYDNLDDFIKNELEVLSFDDLMSVPESAFKEWAERQRSTELAEQRSEGSVSKIDTICANAMSRAAEINAANSGQFRQQDRDHEIETQGE